MMDEGLNGRVNDIAQEQRLIVEVNLDEHVCKDTRHRVQGASQSQSFNFPEPCTFAA